MPNGSHYESSVGRFSIAFMNSLDLKLALNFVYTASFENVGEGWGDRRQTVG